MERVLITGGAGYIGSVVTHHLLTDGYAVRALDSLRFGGKGLRDLTSHPRFEFQQGDIRNSRDVEQAMQGISAVIHLAAIVGEPACDKEPQLTEETNSGGSGLLLEAALKKEVSRFVFASTCSNYGKMTARDGWVDETTPLEPLSLYARTKVGFEQELQRVKHPGFTPVILRLATAYGISPRPRFDLTVNEFAATLASGMKLEVYGEQFWRPYCHVTDIAQACRLALDADNSVVYGQAFNVGSTDENYQKKTLIQLVVEQLPEMRGNVQFVERNHDPRDYRVNCDKIRAALSFQPNMQVADGIREIVAAIRNRSISDFTALEFRNA